MSPGRARRRAGSTSPWTTGRRASPTSSSSWSSTRSTAGSCPASCGTTAPAWPSERPPPHRVAPPAWPGKAQRGSALPARLGTAWHGLALLAELGTAWHCWHGSAQPSTARHSLALLAQGGRTGASSAQRTRGQGHLLYQQPPPVPRLCPRGPGVPVPLGPHTLKHFLPPTQHQPQVSPSVPWGPDTPPPPGQVGSGGPQPQDWGPGGGGVRGAPATVSPMSPRGQSNCDVFYTARIKVIFSEFTPRLL